MKKKNIKEKKGTKKVIISSIILTLLVVGICFLFVPLFKNLKFGLDLQGGFEVLYEVAPLNETDELTSDMLYSTYKSILKRIDVLGVSEPEITIEGEAPSANMLSFPLELSMNTSGRGTYTSYISKYEISKNQDAKMEYIGADPRNETTFIINDMKASLDSLDETLMKKKKESRSKFARVQKEKEYGRKM